MFRRAFCLDGGWGSGVESCKSGRKKEEIMNPRLRVPSTAEHNIAER